MTIFTRQRVPNTGEVVLRQLTIKRFKSIYEAKIEFGRINLFIGVNGTGKSNVLEAIGLLAAALSRGLDGVDLDSRGVRFSVPNLFKSSFRNTRLSPTFRLEAKFENGQYNCSIRAGSTRSSLEFHSEELFDRGRKVFGRGPNGNTVNRAIVDVPGSELRSVAPNRGFWDVLSPFANVSDSLRAELEQVSQYAIYAPQTAIMRGTATDSRLAEPLGLTGANLAGAFQEALAHRVHLSPDDRKKFADILSLIWAPGWAKQIQVGGYRPDIVPSQVSATGPVMYILDQYMKTNRNTLSTFDASEGTLYLVFVATLLLHPKTPNSFALDNVDGTLNAKLVRQLTDKLVAICTDRIDSAELRAYQGFVTSHHPASLDAFDLFSDMQRIFVARRRTEGVAGATYFDRLKPAAGVSKDDWVRQREGKNLSELLLEGLIPGGL